MNRPFTIARAVDLETKRIVEGRLVDRDFIRGDHGELSFVDEDNINFNTGIVDRDGVEIFTGDLLQHIADDKQHTRYEAEYLVDDGAFYIRHTETGTSYSHNYRAFSEELIRTDRTHIIHERLTANVAKQFRIVTDRQFEPSTSEDIFDD